MAAETIRHVIQEPLHQSGIASSTNWPVIYSDFDIVFSREQGSSTVSWSLPSESNVWYSGNTQNGEGGFGYPFHYYISIDVSSPTDDDLWTIMWKPITDYGNKNWVNSVHCEAPSSSFTCAKDTATLYIWAAGGDEGCYHDVGGELYPCYNGSLVLLHTITLSVPTYEVKYPIVYDANGGTGAPDNQVKSSLSDLILSSDEPTYPLSITYHNNPDDVRSVSRTFIEWQAYDNCSTSSYLYRADGDGTTTRFPRSAQGFNPEAGTIDRVQINKWYTSNYTFEDNHVIFDEAPPVGERNVNIYWTSKPSYSGAAGTYSLGDTYTENKAAYMVAQWGSASFNPIALPVQYVTITFNFNGGTGSPSSKTVARASLGYDTSSSSSAYPYVPGTTATTTTDLELYPKYGNATLAYSQLPTPTRAGYSFTGWYRDSQLTDLIPVGTDIVTSVNMTIYAGWSALPLHQFTSGGEWGSIGPYVWQFGSDQQWHKVAHVYKFDGTNWIDLSDS